MQLFPWVKNKQRKVRQLSLNYTDKAMIPYCL